MSKQHSGAWVRATAACTALAAAVNLLLLASPVRKEPLIGAGIALLSAALICAIAVRLSRRAAAPPLSPPRWWAITLASLTVVGTAVAARNGVTDAVVVGSTVLVAASVGAAIAAGPLTLLEIRRSAAAQGIDLPDSPTFLTRQTFTELALDAHRSVTTGSMQVISAEPLDPEHLNNMLFFAGALARSSDERFAQALARRAGRGRVTGFRKVDGGGMTGSVDRHPVRLGAPVPNVPQTAKSGGLSVAVEVDYRALGVITLDEEIRPDAAAVSARIQQRLPVTLLTDTDPTRTEKLATAVGLPTRIADADAEARRQHVQKAKKDGALVVFAGEQSGLNALALDECDLAITTGSDEPSGPHEMRVAEFSVGAVERSMALVASLPGRLRPVRTLALGLSVLGAVVGATGVLPLAAAVAYSLGATAAVVAFAVLQARKQ